MHQFFQSVYDTTMAVWFENAPTVRLSTYKLEFLILVGYWLAAIQFFKYFAPLHVWHINSEFNKSSTKNNKYIK